MKIVKSLEESGLLIEFVSEAIKNEAKKQEGMLLGTLGASLLGNLLIGKAVKNTWTRSNYSRWRHDSNRLGFLMPPYPHN